MKKYIHSLFLALIAISAVIGTASCSTDEEQGNDSATVENSGGKSHLSGVECATQKWW